MIQRVRILNFKCFGDCSIEFGELTLLTGLNGMGKSSVLQSLLLLRQSHHQGLLSTSGLALNGDLVRLGTGKDVLFEGAGKEELILFKLSMTNGVSAEWSFDYSADADVLRLSSRPVPKIFGSNLFNDKFHYLQAERIGPRASFEMSGFSVRQHKQYGSRGQYVAHYLSSFGNEEIPNRKLSHVDARSLQLIHQVEAWMGEIAPGTRLHFVEHPGMDLIKLNFSFVTDKYESNSYRPTNVGFGITYTLPLLVAILSAEPGELLLLENPEAHLHPRGQACLGRLMAMAASSGVQIIAETHSDHVLNGIRVAIHEKRVEANKVRIHFFERSSRSGVPESVVVSPNIDSDGRIDEWPKGFFDEWDAALDKLLSPPE